MRYEFIGVIRAYEQEAPDVAIAAALAPLSVETAIDFGGAEQSGKGMIGRFYGVPEGRASYPESIFLIAAPAATIPTDFDLEDLMNRAYSDNAFHVAKSEPSEKFFDVLIPEMPEGVYDVFAIAGR